MWFIQRHKVVNYKHGHYQTQSNFFLVFISQLLAFLLFCKHTFWALDENLFFFQLDRLKTMQNISMIIAFLAVSSFKKISLPALRLHFLPRRQSANKLLFLAPFTRVVLYSSISRHLIARIKKKKMDWRERCQECTVGINVWFLPPSNSPGLGFTKAR